MRAMSKRNVVQEITEAPANSGLKHGIEARILERHVLGYYLQKEFI